MQNIIFSLSWVLFLFYSLVHIFFLPWYLLFCCCKLRRWWFVWEAKGVSDFYGEACWVREKRARYEKERILQIHIARSLFFFSFHSPSSVFWCFTHKGESRGEGKSEWASANTCGIRWKNFPQDLSHTNEFLHFSVVCGSLNVVQRKFSHFHSLLNFYKTFFGCSRVFEWTHIKVWLVQRVQRENHSFHL